MEEQSTTKIREIFTSIQGEGPCIGQKHIFVRFCKCNLTCDYCDTDFQARYAQKYTPKGCSSIIGFGIKGGAVAGEKFINNLQIPIHTTNIGDSRSIITYPALTTHRQLNEEEKIACGVSDDFMRLSVGLEDVEDLMQDIDQALKKSQE